MNCDTNEGPCECGAWHPLIYPNIPFGMIQPDRLIQYYEQIHRYYEKWTKRLIKKLIPAENTIQPTKNC
jgi:hypothetical protein